MKAALRIKRTFLSNVAATTSATSSSLNQMLKPEFDRYVRSPAGIARFILTNGTRISIDGLNSTVDYVGTHCS